MPPNFSFQVVERRHADPVFAAQLGSLHARLMLLQDPDDLLFRLPDLSTPGPAVQFTRKLQLQLAELSGARQSHPTHF